jgi:hypothetical protein
MIMNVKVKKLPANASANDYTDAIAQNLSMSKDVVRGAGWDEGQLKDAFKETASYDSHASGVGGLFMCMSVLAAFSALAGSMEGTMFFGGGAAFAVAMGFSIDSNRRDMVKRIQGDALYNATQARNTPQPQAFAYS